MRLIVMVGLVLSALFFAGVAQSQSQGKITGLRIGGDENTTRLVIETSHEVPVSLFLLSNPYRLVVDMPPQQWRVKDKGASGPFQTSLLNGYRYGMPAADISRLVIDLEGPVLPVDVFRLAPDKGGYRLVIDLSARGETAFQLAAHAFKKRGKKPLEIQRAKAPSQTNLAIILPQPRPKTLKPESRKKSRTASGILLPQPRPDTQVAETQVAKKRKAKAPADKWVVFIDAGHGGRDPGAISISGVKEKSITLRAAIELAAQLNATGRIKAVLSRNDDTFYRLRKRISLAREAMADVFISLHADAAPNRKARGVSVFTLSETASDKEAALLAAKENKADLIGGPDLDTTDPVITSAILDMFQRESMNQSSVLAAEISNAFDGLPTPDRGHRFAGFAVLKSPDVPSVLIEMGFLTNRDDEKNLNKKSYRRDLMKRITAAVLRYLEQNTALAPQTL